MRRRPRSSKSHLFRRPDGMGAPSATHIGTRASQRSTRSNARAPCSWVPAIGRARIPAGSPSPADLPTRLPARPRRRPLRPADQGVSAVVPDEGRRSPARQRRCSDLGTPARPYEAGSEAGDGFDPAFTRRPAASRSVTPDADDGSDGISTPVVLLGVARRSCPCADDADEELARRTQPVPQPTRRRPPTHMLGQAVASRPPRRHRRTATSPRTAWSATRARGTQPSSSVRQRPSNEPAASADGRLRA